MGKIMSGLYKLNRLHKRFALLSFPPPHRLAQGEQRTHIHATIFQAREELLASQDFLVTVVVVPLAKKCSGISGDEILTDVFCFVLHPTNLASLFLCGLSLFFLISLLLSSLTQQDQASNKFSHGRGSPHFASELTAKSRACGPKCCSRSDNKSSTGEAIETPWLMGFEWPQNQLVWKNWACAIKASTE